jgi:hypothetical protein
MPAHAANIITFGDNPTACGGSVVCNGGNPYNLSQIHSWFQTEPNGQSSSQFLVKNDTGAVVTSISFTLTGTFVPTNGSNENFQIQNGAEHFWGTLALSGPAFVAYTQGPNSTSAAANFSALPVTYTWSGGSGIAAGATFDITLASWVSNEAPTSAPEPSASLLFATGLAGLLGVGWWYRPRAA